MSVLAHALEFRSSYGRLGKREKERASERERERRENTLHHVSLPDVSCKPS
jgi:hypothetical protein